MRAHAVPERRRRNHGLPLHTGVVSLPYVYWRGASLYHLVDETLGDLLLHGAAHHFHLPHALLVKAAPRGYKNPCVTLVGDALDRFLVAPNNHADDAVRYGEPVDQVCVGHRLKRVCLANMDVGRLGLLLHVLHTLVSLALKLVLHDLFYHGLCLLKVGVGSLHEYATHIILYHGLESHLDFGA